MKMGKSINSKSKKIKSKGIVPTKDEYLPNKSPEISSRKIKSQNNKSTGIPKYVANRMARRIAITTGIPTISGMAVFVVSYLLISKGIADIPPGITLITSALCFLLGLAGLSYGILSASWDQGNGSILGFENIGKNISRIKSAFSSKTTE